MSKLLNEDKWYVERTWRNYLSGIQDGRRIAGSSIHLLPDSDKSCSLSTEYSTRQSSGEWERAPMNECECGQKHRECARVGSGWRPSPRRAATPTVAKTSTFSSAVCGGCLSVQEPPAPAERDGQRGAGPRNSVVGVRLPKAEYLWREQGQHPINSPCYGIAAGSSQHHPRKIHRETLCKTARGSDRVWSELTVRDSVIWGDGECENSAPPPPCPGLWCCSVQATQKVSVGTCQWVQQLC